MKPASFRPSELRELNWRITLGGLLLSLALHALLFQLIPIPSYSGSLVRRQFEVKLLPPTKPAAAKSSSHRSTTRSSQSSPAIRPEPSKAKPPAPAPRVQHRPPRTRTEPAPATVTRPLPQRHIAPSQAISPPPEAAQPNRPAPIPTPPAPAAAPPVAKPTGPTPGTAPAPPPAPGPPVHGAASQAATGSPQQKILPPTYLNTPRPDYPQLARRRGWQGTVLLKVFVNLQGGVTRVELIKSSGHEVLDRAALRQVREWRFTPARKGNRAVASEALVPVDFVLDGS